MPARLVALDEGSDIPLDRTMVVVGRHPQCDARLDSLRVSRHHCCMTLDEGDVVVRDLGSTNGVRINGQRVEIGRLRPGDELSIAHIRYRLDNGAIPEQTLADAAPRSDPPGHPESNGGARLSLGAFGPAGDFEQPLAAAVRDMLPNGMANNCRIQVIVRMDKEFVDGEVPAACQPGSSPSP